MNRRDFLKRGGLGVAAVVAAPVAVLAASKPKPAAQLFVGKAGEQAKTPVGVADKVRFYDAPPELFPPLQFRDYDVYPGDTPQLASLTDGSNAVALHSHHSQAEWEKLLQAGETRPWDN